MRHYEIVFLVHPNQSNNLDKIITYYTNIVKSNNGTIHRLENWGRRQLAYPINKLHKAFYVLMNIEISQIVINLLENDLRLNEYIIRSIIIRVKQAITKESPMIRIKIN